VGTTVKWNVRKWVIEVDADYSLGLGEAFAGREVRPVVDDGHAIAEKCADVRERLCYVAGAYDHEFLDGSPNFGVQLDTLVTGADHPDAIFGAGIGNHGFKDSPSFCVDLFVAQRTVHRNDAVGRSNESDTSAGRVAVPSSDYDSDCCGTARLCSLDEQCGCVGGVQAHWLLASAGLSV
jgi:hypothetical protein